MGHRIKKQRIELALQSEVGSFSLQSEVQAIYYRTLVPAIEAWCERVGGGERIITIDQLELDLGVVAKSNLEEALLQALTASLKTLFLEKLSTQSHTQESRMEEALITYLQKGTLPWWGESYSVNALMESWIFGAPSSTQSSLLWHALIEALESSSVMRSRFIEAFRNVVRNIQAPHNRGVITPAHSRVLLDLLLFKEEKRLDGILRVDLIYWVVSQSAFRGLDEMEHFLGEVMWGKLFNTLAHQPLWRIKELRPQNALLKELIAIVQHSSSLQIKTIDEKPTQGLSIRESKPPMIHDDEMDAIKRESSLKGLKKSHEDVLKQSPSNVQNASIRDNGAEKTSDLNPSVFSDISMKSTEIQSISSPDERPLEVLESSFKEMGFPIVFKQGTLPNADISLEKSECLEARNLVEGTSQKFLKQQTIEQRQGINKEEKSAWVMVDQVMKRASLQQSHHEKLKAWHIKEASKKELYHTSHSASVFAQSQRWNEHEERYLKGCGVVLFWPFLQRFFETLDLLEEGTFKTPTIAQKGVLLLHYLLFENLPEDECELALLKILCGLHPETVMTLSIECSDEEYSQADALLNALKHHWTPMKNSSDSGVREAFLQRFGVLRWRDGEWLLQVETKTIDILLSQLPWSYTIVKLPWMEHYLRVEWDKGY